MGKNRWQILLGITLIIFLSCDNGGGSTGPQETTDEAYAGTWYREYVDATWGTGIMIYRMTDTSFTITIYLDIGVDVVAAKGHLTKLSETEVYYEETFKYAGAALETRTVTYSLSADEKTLVFDGTTFSSTNPRA